ncbi:glutamate-1-semialdehyde 2,1-aminomutase [Azospirillum soli]|uniref:glutamate-1-semialdehyde 2,1-aminomutase n=1 Tax=Azospirillum soli TaxID=1304799 RepID=UPI001AE2B7BE|nr:glutamate-1-semialdehyde 2,1-aminomutase [Azospirillum soli]MBP2316250.1 glutamate-1-semialdehyde 2,1-aminomutase [Azospirillum soli]
MLDDDVHPTPHLPQDVIPGGGHTYSKGDDQFPANAPRFLERGEGAIVWDDQGRSYLDWTMGLRTMSLGYGNADVIEAAIEQIRLGSNFGRPSRVESDAAADLLNLLPHAEMVKFAKNGSTATTAAVKLARAYTGRDLVALCSDHPFFSYDDWFIGTTACDAGVPEAIKRLSLTFRYNDLDSVRRLFDAHPGQIAALIMEAATSEPPRDGFLQGVQDLCRRNGTVFILDEMITGFRWHLNGAQAYYGLAPDLSTFGKGIANGFSVSALVGRRDIMELGGLRSSQPRVFLVSTTHGAENHALAAMRATLRVFSREPVIEHLWNIGGALIEGLNAAAADVGIAAHFQAAGYPCSPVYACRDSEGAVSLPLRTLFLQEMARRGILCNYLAPSYAHTAADVVRTVDAARDAFIILSRALDAGWQSLLEGVPIKPVFRQFN